MDFARSIGYASRSLGLYREIGDVLGAVRQLNILGWANSIYNADAALQFFEEALAISNNTGVGDVIGNAYPGRPLSTSGRNDRRRQTRLAAARDEFERAGQRYIDVYGRINSDGSKIRPRIRKPPSLLSADALRMASEAGEAGVSAPASPISPTCCSITATQSGGRARRESDRRLRQVGGATTTEMSGLEPPLQRATRILDAPTFARMSSDEEALTIDDAVREALAYARRVETGREKLHV